jgi:pentatricopeptide repeat protein
MYALEEGELIHDQIVKRGLLKQDNFLSNALVSMYAKCGALAKAQQVHDEFRAPNIISWSSLISGYAEHGQGHEALECFRRMQLEGISPDIITFVCILKACCGTLAIHKGQQIHHEIVSRGLIEKNGVLGNALVDMYAKCGVLPKAQQVHDNLEGRNVVSWSALIAGYVEHGQGHEALNCFDRMQNEEGLYPNAITFTCILKACTITGAIDKGKEIHELILRRGLLEKDIVLGNALVDMYAKCGMFEKALEVHEEIPVRTIISTNALIAGYAQKGRGHEALDCFRRMQCERLSPDDITFLCVLNACSQSGLVDEAEVLFRSMKEEYSVAPSIEHRTWMVLIFASVGNFDKAVFMIQTMPATRDFCPIWHALLGGCRKWGNVELGRLAFDHVLWLDNTCAAAYVQMSSIYTAAGMHENAKSVDLMRLKNAVSEKPESVVWVDSSGNTHSFFICENTSSR